MIKLDNQYKPLTQPAENIKLDNTPKQRKLEDKNSFKQQFVKIRQSYERTPEQRIAAVKEQCVELETELVKIMVSQMFKTINKTGFIDGGAGEEMFKGMLHDQYAESLSKNSNLGIAEQIYKQIAGYTGF